MLSRENYALELRWALMRSPAPHLTFFPKANEDKRILFAAARLIGNSCHAFTYSSAVVDGNGAGMDVLKRQGRSVAAGCLAGSHWTIVGDGQEQP